MRKTVGNMDAMHIRALEWLVEERLFLRPSSDRTPRYARDPRAMGHLIDRLSCLGLVSVTTPNGLVIEDLCLGTSYFYGVEMGSPARPATIRPGPLLVRAALFAVASRTDIHLRSRPRPSGLRAWKRAVRGEPMRVLQVA